MKYENAIYLNLNNRNKRNEKKMKKMKKKSEFILNCVSLFVRNLNFVFHYFYVI